MKKTKLLLGARRHARATAIALVTSFIAACEVPPASDASSQTGTRSARYCVRGTELDSEALQTREAEWKRIETAKVKVQETGDDPESCAAAQKFASECPRWDRDLADVVEQVCQVRTRTCERGKKLTKLEHRQREEAWVRVIQVRGRAQPVDPPQLEYACRTAKDFAQNCTDWDSDTKKVAKELCEESARDCAPLLDAKAKKVSAGMIRPEIESLMRMDLAIESLTDPNTAKKAIETGRKKVVAYKCYAPDAGPALEEKFDAWADKVEQEISEEIKCRASEACRARRIANSICGTIEDKKEALQMIARERKNPGHVVNLRTLHDLGERVQADDASIAESKRDYMSLAKKPFTEALCRSSK